MAADGEPLRYGEDCRGALDRSALRGRVVLLSIFAVLAASCAGSQASSSDPSQVVERIASRWSEGGRLAGFVVAVARDGEVVVESAYGTRDPVTAEPLDATAELDYFSVGKHVTAVLLLRLAERGLIDLDVPAGHLLPDADFHGAEVTTRQLLSHTSGLWEPELDEMDPPSGFGEPPLAGGVLASANRSARHAPPGETWMYSGAGFLFAGLVAEAVTGSPLDTLVERELRAPLGLRRFHPCARVLDTRAPGFHGDDEGFRPIPPIDPRWFGGAGSICGSAGDLVRWWLALRQGRVIGRASLERMLSPVELARRGATARFGYGLGVRLGELAGRRKIGHTGSGAGGTSVLAEYPDDGLVIAVITNTAGGGVPEALEIEAEIASALLAAGDRSTGAGPTPPALLASAPGLYRSPTTSFCVTARQNALWRSTGGAQAVRPTPLAGGRFSDGADGAGVEYFLGTAGGKAQWFAYDRLGFPSDLAVRTSDRCDEAS